MAATFQQLRFPRPGLPVLAPSLRSLFRSRIRHPILPDGTLQTALDELGAGVWAHRSQAECKLIANALGNRLSQMQQKGHSKLAALRVPDLDPPQLLELLPLSEMLIETLKRCGINDTEQLAQRTIAQLMELPTVGSRRVLELIAVLDSLRSEVDPTRPAPHTVCVTCGEPADIERLTEIDALLGIDDVPVTDVRFGELILQLRTGKPFLRAALVSLKTGMVSNGHDPWPFIRPTLVQLAERLRRVRGFKLNEDLVDVLQSLTTGRKADIVARRLGWYDGQEHTLQQVGDSVALTRERVRQMEARAQQKLHGRTVFIPTLQQALQLAQRMSPCTATAFSEALKNRGLTESLWSPALLVRAAGYFGIPHGLTLQEFEGTEFLAGEALTSEIFSRVRRLSWSHARQEGAAHLPRIAFELSEEIERRVSLEEIRSIVSALSGTRWIDGESGWFWFGDDGNTAIFNTLRKILSVSKRIQMDELYEGLLRSYRMDDAVVAPKSVLLKMLAQVPWIRIRQLSHVTAHPPLNWQEELTETERRMVQVLKEAGGVLDHYDWKRRCMALGVKKSTFQVYEGNSALFVRLAQGIWCLRGVEFDPHRMVQARQKNAERQLNRALALSARHLAMLPTPALMGSPEKLLQLYQVTASAFRNYCVTFARLKHLPVGTRFKVVLDSKVLGQVGLTDDQRLRGLIPHLKRAGVQAGEAFLAQFDLAELEIRLDRLVGEGEGPS